MKICTRDKSILLTSGLALSWQTDCKPVKEAGSSLAIIPAIAALMDQCISKGMLMTPGA